MSTTAGDAQERKPLDMTDPIGMAVETLEREASRLESLRASGGAADMAALLRALQADWRAVAEARDPERLERVTTAAWAFLRVYPRWPR
jgi:hypothetical protein